MHHKFRKEIGDYTEDLTRIAFREESLTSFLIVLYCSTTIFHYVYCPFMEGDVSAFKVSSAMYCFASLSILRAKNRKVKQFSGPITVSVSTQCQEDSSSAPPQSWLQKKCRTLFCKLIFDLFFAGRNIQGNS